MTSETVDLSDSPLYSRDRMGEERDEEVVVEDASDDGVLVGAEDRSEGVEDLQNRLSEAEDMFAQAPEVVLSGLAETPGPTRPEPEELKAFLRLVCTDSYPRHSDLDVDRWVDQVVEKLKKIGIEDLPKLINSLSVLNQQLVLAEERAFHTSTIRTMRNLASTANVTGRSGPRGRNSRGRFQVVSSPVSRTPNGFIRAAVRQSFGTIQPADAAPAGPTEEERRDAEDKRKRTLESSAEGPVVDGRTLKVRPNPRDVDSYVPARQWNKEERASLEPDVRQIFVKQATGYVLSKNNKLDVPRVFASSEDQLVQVQNLQNQLKTMRAHMAAVDIIDVFTVVVPVNVQKESTLEKKKFDLFDDFNHLHPAHICNSNSWYHLWVDNEYVQDNMVLTLTFLQHNTSETLWSRCWDRYEEYPTVQQGGPLMAYLILKTIQDSSDQALEHLTNQLKGLKISKLPGEDVSQAIILIKSTYRVLKTSSTNVHSYVPTDFAKIVYDILLTSTVRAFTEPFRSQLARIQLKADFAGTRPDYPSVTTLLQAALSSYNRLMQSGVYRPSKSNPAAHAARNTGGPPPRRDVSSHDPERLCWNCGENNHMLPDCKKPRNQERIDRARKDFFAKKKGDLKPQRKTGPGGKPLILTIYPKILEFPVL